MSDIQTFLRHNQGLNSTFPRLNPRQIFVLKVILGETLEDYYPTIEFHDPDKNKTFKITEEEFLSRLKARGDFLEGSGKVRRFVIQTGRQASKTSMGIALAAYLLYEAQNSNRLIRGLYQGFSGSWCQKLCTTFESSVVQTPLYPKRIPQRDSYSLALDRKRLIQFKKSIPVGQSAPDFRIVDEVFDPDYYSGMPPAFDVIFTSKNDKGCSKYSDYISDCKAHLGTTLLGLHTYELRDNVGRGSHFPEDFYSGGF